MLRRKRSRPRQYCKILLVMEDDDLIDGQDADAEGDPEMEKALFGIRKLVARVSELSA
jgi:hypothetical protein